MSPLRDDSTDILVAVCLPRLRPVSVGTGRDVPCAASFRLTNICGEFLIVTVFFDTTLFQDFLTAKRTQCHQRQN